LTYIVSFFIPWKTFNCIVLGANATIFSVTNGGFHWFSNQSVFCVFLRLKSKYLTFVYNQTPIHVD
jgi:hypothetical protein